MDTSSASVRSSSRVERKRQQARLRIIAAAADLLREKSADQLTIADITAAADVGHGTFYLHFKSKHDVLLPVLQEEAETLDAQLRASLQDETDPAAIMGLSARFMANHILGDDLWRWFLSSSGVPMDTIRMTLGRFSDRDYLAGVRSGRFRTRNPEMTAVFCFGGYVSALLQAMRAQDPRALVDATAEALLISLGIPEGDAIEIATRPLPTVSKDLATERGSTS